LDAELAGGEIEIRGGELCDLDALVSIMLACKRSQRPWARANWSPPVAAVERRLWQARLCDPRTQVAVATTGATRVGCISLWPARTETRRDRGVPYLAYLSGPFVDPEWWGEGIGTDLHEEALAVMTRSGYRRGELLVEAGNRRGRRFLERNGWHRVDEPLRRTPLALVSYARALPEPELARFTRSRMRPRRRTRA
jgi:RimJ/RimL family protein N-acetyltransferase